MGTGRRNFTLGLGAMLAGCSAAANSPRAEGQPVDYRIGLVDEDRPAPGTGKDVWAKGYSQAELDEAQEKFDLVFPPDLVALLRERRPAQGYDWRTDETQIRDMLRWPLEGLLFDVENNALWQSGWGDRPRTPEARAEALTAIVNAAPKLIPLVSHRYLPAEPHEAGNPVLSVHQSDVIYYGADLADYFEREFGHPTRPLPRHIKRIPFWSDLVELNG